MITKKIKNYLLALTMLSGLTSWSQCSGFSVDFDFDIVGGDINFTNTSVGEGSSSTYSWTYASQTSSLENPTMTAEVGTYLACLTVTTIIDSIGSVCTGTFCDSVYWDGDTTSTGDPCDTQVAGFTYSISGDDVNMTNTSTGVGAFPSYSWTYGSQTSSLEDPTFIGESGWSEACLTVVSMIDSVTCSAVFCDSVYFEADSTGGSDPCADLVANFDIDIVGSSVNVTNTSTGEGEWSDYNWTYGTQTSTSENPTFTGIEGLEVVCLTLVSYYDSGSVVCTAYLCDSVYYEDSTSTDPCDDLLGNFSWTYTLDDVIVTNTSSGEGEWSDYNWTYGTQTSTDENPIFDPEWGPNLICLTLVSYYDSGSVVCTVVICDTINYDTASVSVSSIEEIGSVLIYPNPVDNELSISIDSEGYDLLEVYNAFGQLVYTENYQYGIRQKSIQTESLAPGMYILKVFDSVRPERIITERFVRR
jgi:hypothetical protein